MLHSVIETENLSASSFAMASGGESNIRTLQAHEALFYEGDDTANLYEVIEGVVRVYKIFADGRRQVISFAYPGDLIGFGQAETFRFDCDALTRARVRVIPQNSLLRAVRERPELGEKILAIAANQVNSMQDLSIMLCRKSAIERLASFLIYLVRRSPESMASSQVSLPMTRADIADYLGLTIETVSRNFTKLRTMGIIALVGTGAVQVRDMNRLRQLSECEDSIH